MTEQLERTVIDEIVDFRSLRIEDGEQLDPLPALSHYFGRRPEWKFADKYDP